MFFRLLALFTVVPIIELALLIEVGKRIGSLETILLVLATGVLGAYLAKSEGLAVFQRVRFKLERGEMPEHELLEGLFILVGGILLLTPGLITDIIGLSAIMPPTRIVLRQWVRRRITRLIKKI